MLNWKNKQDGVDDVLAEDINNIANELIASQISIDQLKFSKQEKLTAGDGINIDENNVISATGGGGSGGAVNDVQINGESIVTDGVANIPIASQNKAGIISYNSKYGMQLIGNTLAPLGWTTFIDSRKDAFATYSKLDYAVRAAMCDGKGAEWTDTERIAALLRMGCTVDDNGFVKWTAQEAAE